MSLASRDEDQTSQLTPAEVKALWQSSSFCILPWLHIYLPSSGAASPCCTNFEYVYGHTRDHGLQDLLDTPQANALRAEMISGRLPASCFRCQSAETQYGAISYRMDMNRRYADQQELVVGTTRDGKRAQRKMLYLDLRFSNLCNFACVMCDEHNSSSYAQNEAKAGRWQGPIVQSAIANWPQFWQFVDEQAPHLDEIYLCGGEPLIIEAQWDLLRRLIDRGHTHIRLRYNSNLSMLSWNRTPAFELWEKFRSVNLHASVDASGERAAWIRRGTKWPQVLENMQQAVQFSKSHPQFNFFVAPTVQILNALHLVDLHDELLRQEAAKPDHFAFNLLRTHTYFSIQNLPDADKARVARDWDGLKSRLGTSHEAQNMRTRLDEMRAFMLQAPTAPARAERAALLASLKRQMNFEMDDFFRVFPEARNWELTTSPDPTLA
ncbi:MAG TPA: twitch domain-containing radical SAM protein [Pseudobdellovibrionaceae bacterium]|nr:twitch domain-containing radical SAM protein [Pseudobdellovibrionaceae bacterium]